MKDRLIVALDVATIAEAKAIIAELEGVVSFFKIGYWLYLQRGVDELYGRTTSGGKRLFLDAKLFDVPQTISRGIRSIISLGASFVTVHGDPEIMQAAVKAAEGTNLNILAVTVLTNLDDGALREMGYGLKARDLVMLKAKSAVQAGCQGIIASADDNPDRIRELTESADLLIVTPGIRLEGGDRHDQKRIATPREAILNGADYLVVGRPIVEHPQHSDIRSAAQDIIVQMQRGWDERQSAPARLAGRRGA